MPIFRYLFRCLGFFTEVKCDADGPRSPTQRRTEGSTCGDQLRVALAESPRAASIQISDDDGPVMPSVDGEATATERGAATHPGDDLQNHLNDVEREEDARHHLPGDADLIQTSGDDGPVMPSVDGEATATERGVATHPGDDIQNHLNNVEREEDARHHLPGDADLIQTPGDDGPVMPSVDGEATATERGVATHPGDDLQNHLNNVEREEDARHHLPGDADLIQTSGDDGSVIPVADDGCDSHHRDDAQNLEEVLYHIAIAESLEYQGLPAIVDLDGFRGFKLDDHDDEEVARLIALELGQSSNNPPPPAPDAHCSICMEDKYSFECMAIKGCSHTYCACCVSQYVASKVEANEARVGCPDPNCETGFLEPEMCRLILPAKVFDRWGCRLCEEGILGSAKFYCPYGDCSALLIDDGGDAVDHSKCPHCMRMFCAQCRVPWHSGYSCKDYETLCPDKKSRDLMKLATKKRWQRCPSCGFFVERTSGCNYIKCR
ncbi:unnamed protein product [Musa acuminata subsp. burmannicoides]